jgi:hypothetical protein
MRRKPIQQRRHIPDSLPPTDLDCRRKDLLKTIACVRLVVQKPIRRFPDQRSMLGDDRLPIQLKVPCLFNDYYRRHPVCRRKGVFITEILDINPKNRHYNQISFKGDFELPIVSLESKIDGNGNLFVNFRRIEQ